MMNILLFPFRLIGMVIGFVIDIIGSVFGFLTGLIGGIFGLITGIIGVVVSGAVFIAVVVGVVMLIRWFVRGVRGV